MPGRTPTKNPRRRNARPDWRRLPADGRSGKAPEWPLSEPSDAERAVWAELWASPQAVAWEQAGWTRVVARYCRLLVFAEGTNVVTPAAQLQGEVRQLEDRLGLSPMAMRRLQWEISTEDDDTETDSDAVARLDDYRKRANA